MIAAMHRRGRCKRDSSYDQVPALRGWLPTHVAPKLGGTRAEACLGIAHAVCQDGDAVDCARRLQHDHKSACLAVHCMNCDMLMHHDPSCTSIIAQHTAQHR